MAKKVFSARTTTKHFWVSSGVRNLKKGNKYRVLTSPINGNTSESNTKDFKTKSSAIRFGKRYLGIK